MKPLAIAIFVLTICTSVYPQQCREASISAEDKTLYTIQTASIKKASKDDELELRLRARVDGAWNENGREGAVVSVFVDGQYRQDVLLFAGRENFEYIAPLGRLDSKIHRKVHLVFNKELSASGLERVELISARIEAVDDLGRQAKVRVPSKIQKLAHSYSPMIYVRPETIGRFSDIPLLTYYEVLPAADGAKTIRYTTVFTNEDGGTNSQALLARWGRLTDIEFVYEATFARDGSVVSEKIQGVNHKIQDFKGKRIGLHPLILDAADNNNFSDAGCSKILLSPPLVAMDLTGRSRESVMDRFPWTHRIMAEEAQREGRIVKENFGPNAVDDPRNYFYFDLATEMRETAFVVEMILKDGVVYSSDLNMKGLRVDRSGVVRVAVRKPRGSLQAELPAEARVACYSKREDMLGTCSVSPVSLITLDREYRPIKVGIARKTLQLKSGESAVIFSSSEK